MSAIIKEIKTETDKVMEKYNEYDFDGVNYYSLVEEVLGKVYNIIRKYVS